VDYSSLTVIPLIKDLLLDEFSPTYNTGLKPEQAVDSCFMRW